MNVAIFLDDVNEFNGPLMFIPGSHKKGVVEAQARPRPPPAIRCGRSTTTLIAQAGGARRRKNGGIVAPKGPAGSMILFHSCLVHASTAATCRRGTA